MCCIERWCGGRGEIVSNQCPRRRSSSVRWGQALPVVDRPASAIRIAADEADAERRVAHVRRLMFFYQARSFGAADGARRFATGYGVLAVGKFQFGGMARFVEWPQVLVLDVRIVVSFVHKLATESVMSAAKLHELTEKYRPEFPIFQSATYLNSCSLGALSTRSRSALTEFADLWDRWGASAWYEYWLAAAQDVRSAFARLVGADESETALAPSISAALATVTSALPFDRRNRVVTTELDFPTVVYQFLAKERSGVEVVVLESPDGVDVPVEAFADAVDDRTALIATSHVYYTTGAIQDVGALSRIAHDHGALCLIDAYQSTGQLPVDAKELDVDILLTGALKWLLGGQGLAYTYVRGELIDRLIPTTVSWFGVEDQFAFDSRSLRLRSDARRYELGTPAVPTIYTARAGLALVEEVGVERIRRRISSLTEDLIEKVRTAGLSVRGASDAERRSGIVMIEHPEPAEAVRKLKANAVICDYRPGAVRLSPHFYNTTGDSQKAVELLAG